MKFIPIDSTLMNNMIMTPPINIESNSNSNASRWSPIIFFLLIVMSITGHTQNAELEKRNGFKDIKLGMVADSVKGIKLKKEFKEKDEYPAKLYTVEHPDYEKIGEVKINKIEIKSYKDLIYEIIIVTDKDQRMMKALESIYGKSGYDMKRETYFWKSDNIVLKFRSHSKNHLELLYISYPVLKMMKADKDQKVDDIANDF